MWRPAAILLGMINVYGVAGCGPCEVTKLFLKGKEANFTFIDLSTNREKRRHLAGRLGSPTSGVILEDGEHVKVMQGVSIAALNRWYQAYVARQEEG